MFFFSDSTPIATIYMNTTTATMSPTSELFIKKKRYRLHKNSARLLFFVIKGYLFAIVLLVIDRFHWSVLPNFQIIVTLPPTGLNTTIFTTSPTTLVTSTILKQ